MAKFDPNVGIQNYDNIAGTLWRVHRATGTALWRRVKGGSVQEIVEQLPFDGIIFVIDEDEFGNLHILTARGFFWTPYQNMKRAATWLCKMENVEI